MSEQTVVLQVMAEADSFDVNPYQGDELDITNDIDNSPETELLAKESARAVLSNPCIGCIHEDTFDPYVLDYCHRDCKDEDIIVLTNEVIEPPIDTPYIVTHYCKNRGMDFHNTWRVELGCGIVSRALDNEPSPDRAQMIANNLDGYNSGLYPFTKLHDER